MHQRVLERHSPEASPVSKTFALLFATMKSGLAMASVALHVAHKLQVGA